MSCTDFDVTNPGSNAEQEKRAERKANAKFTKETHAEYIKAFGLPPAPMRQDPPDRGITG
jgi:hypothetical protein